MFMQKNLLKKDFKENSQNIEFTRINKMAGTICFNYLGMNNECDPFFNNDNQNQKPNSSMGVIFGFDNEIVYHNHFSAIYTFKLYCKFIASYQRYEYHPFE